MSDSDWWFVDLALVAAATGLATFVLLLPVTGPVRILVGLPLVLFLPGYALVSVLYPDSPTERYPPFDDEKTGLQTPLLNDGGLEPVERFVLSVVLSIALVPAAALAATITPLGISAVPILVVLGLATTLFTVLGIVRRARCPADRRYSPALRPSAVLFSRAENPYGSSSTRAFNVVVLFSLLVLVATSGFALANPPQHDTFTEFYLDTDEVDSDTETLYDDTFSAGESRELTTYVANEEQTTVEYTVVATLQRVSYAEDGVEVQEQTELGRTTATVDHGETAEQTLEVSPSMTGENLRITILLYEGTAPENPSAEDAYRSIELPIVVE